LRDCSIDPLAAEIRKIEQALGMNAPPRTGVIAKREALWRSRPAGLDCRAPAGLAMTMMGELS